MLFSYGFSYVSCWVGGFLSSESVLESANPRGNSLLLGVLSVSMVNSRVSIPSSEVSSHWSWDFLLS